MPIDPPNLYTFLIGGPGSDYANYFSLILTIVGFVITIVTVKKSKRASDEAKKEVIKVRNDIKRIDTVNDLSSAISLMDEIRTLQREGKLLLLPDRYSQLKERLISIRQSYPDLTEKQKTTIQNTLLHVTTIESRIEEAIKGRTEPANVPKFQTILSRQKDDMYQMLVELRNSIGGG